MRHIKIYEEYTDDELMGLLGTMRSIGQSRVDLDVDYGPFKGMGEKDRKEEMNVVDNWSFKTPGGEIQVKSGTIKFSPDKEGEVILNMTNGDVIRMKDEKGEDPLFYVNDSPIVISGDAEEYPYSLAVLSRYEHYLKNKFKGKPSFLQNLKSKLGLSESYSDEELRDLQDVLHDVGHSSMWTFGEDFGFGLAPKFKTEITGEEFPVISEKFFNYLLSKGYIVPKGAVFGFKNPEDFGIYKYFDAAIEPSPFPNRYVIHIRSKNPNLFTTRPEMVYVFAKVALELGKIRK